MLIIYGPLELKLWDLLGCSPELQEPALPFHRSSRAPFRRNRDVPAAPIEYGPMGPERIESSPLPPLAQGEPEDRRPRTPGPVRSEVLLGHHAGEELVDLGQDGSAFRRPLCDELVGRRVVGAHVAVRWGADEGPRDLGQSEAEGVALPFADEPQQAGGDALPVADRRPVGAAVQFVGEGGQRDDLARLPSSGEEVVWNGRPFWFDSAHTGTEHVVAIVATVDDVDAIDTKTFGKLVRHHQNLAPLGSNVNFVQIIGDQALKIRTYGRGVEAETLSCGSGAVAAVVIATRRGLICAKTTTVHDQAGTPLVVSPHSERPPGRTYFSGPVTQVFEGELACRGKPFLGAGVVPLQPPVTSARTYLAAQVTSVFGVLSVGRHRSPCPYIRAASSYNNLTGRPLEPPTSWQLTVYLFPPRPRGRPAGRGVPGTAGHRARPLPSDCSRRLPTTARSTPTSFAALGC